MKKLRFLFSFFVLTATLTGCQTMDQFVEDFQDLTSGNVKVAEVVGYDSEILLTTECPQVEIVEDLASISDFTDPGKTNKDILVSRVEMTATESACKLASKSAIVDMTLTFNGSLGPKGKSNASEKPFFSYPYFIAVTSPSGRIIAKEIFAASMTYNANESEHTYFEKLRQVIPIRSKDAANRYKVLVGFQVTKDQLEYNREQIAAARALEAAQKKPDIEPAAAPDDAPTVAVP